MKEISLTQGKVTFVDDEDFDYLSAFKWHVKFMRSGPYAARQSPRINGKQTTILMHRVIMSAPENAAVDHKHGNTLDNRKCVLRLCTTAQNNRNASRRKDNKSGSKGVCWEKSVSKWRADIGIDGTQKYLGVFSKKEDAILAYAQAARLFHGEYARI